ncbi:DUF3329 domain-containing protein [Chromobacterium haemolyticum]|nr:DUF3329 domain-containing protein [Chromobacterium haemolyticum]
MPEFLKRTLASLLATAVIGLGFWLGSSAEDGLIAVAICLGGWLAFNLYHVALLLRWLQRPTPERAGAGRFRRLAHHLHDPVPHHPHPEPEPEKAHPRAGAFHQRRRGDAGRGGGAGRA